MLMKLLVGLWNPWETYRLTRHNAWFLAIDDIALQSWATDFLYQKKFRADIAQGTIGKWHVMFAKPQTYMNKSGLSVASLLEYYDIHRDDMLVLQDDIDLPFGKLKLKYGWSAWGHNGIRDILRVFAHEKFWRYKIGVWRPQHPSHSVVDYVLWRFSPDERNWFDDRRKEIYEKIETRLKNVG